MFAVVRYPWSCMVYQHKDHSIYGTQLKTEASLEFVFLFMTRLLQPSPSSLWSCLVSMELLPYSITAHRGVGWGVGGKGCGNSCYCCWWRLHRTPSWAFLVSSSGALEKFFIVFVVASFWNHLINSNGSNFGIKHLCFNRLLSSFLHLKHLAS